MWVLLQNIFKKIVQFKAIARFALPKIRAQLIKMQLILRTVREKVDVFHLLLQLVLKHKKKKNNNKNTLLFISLKNHTNRKSGICTCCNHSILTFLSNQTICSSQCETRSCRSEGMSNRERSTVNV